MKDVNRDVNLLMKEISMGRVLGVLIVSVQRQASSPSLAKCSAAPSLVINSGISEFHLAHNRAMRCIKVGKEIIWGLPS